MSMPLTYCYLGRLPDYKFSLVGVFFFPILPWTPVNQHRCPASHLSISWAKHPGDLCSRLSANSGKYLCISCISSALCNFSLETEFLTLSKTPETLVCANFHIPRGTGQGGRCRCSLLLGIRGAKDLFLCHNKTECPLEHKGILQMLHFSSVFIDQTEREAQVESVKTRFFFFWSIFARWNINKMSYFTENVKSNCSDT